MAPDSTVRKYIPALAWYQPLEPYAYALIRFSTGALIIPHGIDRLFYSGSRADLAGFLSGVSASAFGVFELVGGVLIALGLLTRPFALLMAIEWIAIAVVMPLRPAMLSLRSDCTPEVIAAATGQSVSGINRPFSSRNLSKLGVHARWFAALPAMPLKRSAP